MNIPHLMMWFYLVTRTIVSDSIRFIINFLKKFPKLGKYLSPGMPLLKTECFRLIFLGAHYFVSDINKIFAVLVAVSSFLYFKNLDIRYSLLRYHPYVGAHSVDSFCKHLNFLFPRLLRLSPQY